VAFFFIRRLNNSRTADNQSFMIIFLKSISEDTFAKWLKFSRSITSRLRRAFMQFLAKN
jgi:hypothetical protein